MLDAVSDLNDFDVLLLLTLDSCCAGRKTLLENMVIDV